MKKAVKYIISAAVAAAYIFIYGFAVGGETGFWFVFPLFTILFIIMSIFNYKDNPGMLKKTIRAILTPVIVVAVSMVMYSAINQTKADLAAEYDAVVTDRVKSTVYFYTPDGNEKQVALNTAIIVPEDEIIHIGDTIHIREYTGLFGVNFFATDSGY